MRRVGGLALAALLLVLTGCGTAPVQPSADRYTVKAGDTLYSIAWRHGVDYRELAKLNRVEKDFRIYPGQVLSLPRRNSAAAMRHPDNPSTKPSNPGTTASLPVSSEPAPRFIVPTAGTPQLTHRPNGGTGWLYQGRLEQEIRAAAAGRVVYSGVGLLGYGQLLIIKHNDQYLSAYGHLQTIAVNEGSEVASGQRIATMGKGPDGKPQLYFEVRINGRAVDPTTLGLRK